MSLNGGETWSSWYSQPTAQLYHVSANNACRCTGIARRRCSARRAACTASWDLRYQPLAPVEPGGSLPIAAVPHATAPAPTTPLVPPGQYVVDLTVNGTTISRTLNVVMDPRVRTPEPELRALFTETRNLYGRAAATAFAITQADDLRAQLAARQQTAAGKPIATTLAEFDGEVLRVRGASSRGRGRRGRGDAPPTDTLVGVLAAVTAAMNALDRADVTPTTAMRQACEHAIEAHARVSAAWEPLVTSRLANLNLQLRDAGLERVVSPAR